MKNKIFTLLFLVALCAGPVFPQVSSVDFSGAVSGSFRKNTDWKIESVKGYGGDVSVKFNLYQNFKLSIRAGYRVFSIKQDANALFAEYNWKYWQRYYGNINDPNFKNATQWVQTLLKGDSTYSATFNPVQDMDVFPVGITLSYEFSPVAHLSVRPYIGSEMLFYQKRLYIDETWKKKFSQLDNYVYSYSFRDMDQYVIGNPIAGQLGIDAEYQVHDLVKLTAGFDYSVTYGPSAGAGYAHFPMRDMFSAKLGVMLLY